MRPAAPLRLLSATAGLALFLAPSLASAQEIARAEALFREAKKLMKEGDYAKACPMLAESYEKDEGLGTLLNLAACNESLGKTATAWGQFLKAASIARKRGDDTRGRVARERSSKLEKKLVRLKVEVPDDARAPGLRIFLNGTELSSAEWGTGIPVDPGTIEVKAIAEGKKDLRNSVEATKEGSTVEFSLSPLEDEPPEPDPEPVPVTPAPEGSVKTTPTTPKEPAPVPGATQRWVGVSIGAVGVAGLIFGGIMGGLAIADWGEVTDGCQQGADGYLCPTDDLVSKGDSASTSSTIATIGLAAGGAFVATGLVIYLTAPGASSAEQATPDRDAGRHPSRLARGPVTDVQVAPLVGPSVGGFSITGRF